MSSLFSRAAFRIFTASLSVGILPKRRRFERGLARPREAQDALLKRILKANRSHYAERFKLDGRSSYEDFARAVPIIDYDDLALWIERQVTDESSWIAPTRPLAYEKTSGSTGASKQIPYTRELLGSFQNLFLLWAQDVCSRGPELKGGRVFMSVSSSAQEQDEGKTRNGVPIGFEDDADYLSGQWRFWIEKFLVIPGEIKRLRSSEDFTYVLSALLLAADDLEVVSIWNPSLLLVVLRTIQDRANEILADCACGYVERQGLRFELKAVSAERHESLLRTEPDWQRVWPELKLISCWAGAHAKPLSDRLATLFPQVWIQPKGLLATEAPLTIPWIEAGGFVPLPDEVFYEFEAEDGRILRLHELETGQRYEIIISQKGGLLRYRMGDFVRVAGSYLGSPLLDFEGRSNAVVDLVGEKLHEGFVASCLAELGGEASAFRCLIPTSSVGGGARYHLLTESASNEAAEILEELLSRAYHYQVARKQGQLAEISLLVREDAEAIVRQYQIDQGVKWGHIKHRPLFSLQDGEALYRQFNPVNQEIPAQISAENGVSEPSFVSRSIISSP